MSMPVTDTSHSSGNGFGEVWQPEPVESIASLAEDMVYRLPGCGDLMVRKTLQNAYREFCQKTDCLVFTDRITLKPSVTDYEVSQNPCGIVECVRKAKIEGDPRFLVLNREYFTLDDLPPKIRVSESLLPSSEESEDDYPVLDAECVIVPPMGGECAPLWFLQRYGHAVVSGAMYRLFSMTGKPWSDAAQAQQEAIRYENALTEAKARSLYPNTSQHDCGHVNVTGGDFNSGRILI